MSIVRVLAMVTRRLSYSLISNYKLCSLIIYHINRIVNYIKVHGSFCFRLFVFHLLVAIFLGKTFLPICENRCISTNRRNNKSFVAISLYIHEPFIYIHVPTYMYIKFWKKKKKHIFWPHTLSWLQSKKYVQV